MGARQLSEKKKTDHGGGSRMWVLSRKTRRRRRSSFPGNLLSRKKGVREKEEISNNKKGNKARVQAAPKPTSLCDDREERLRRVENSEGKKRMTSLEEMESTIPGQRGERDGVLFFV